MPEKHAKKDTKLYLSQLDKDLNRSIVKHDLGSQFWLLFLLLIIGTGLYSYIIQLRDGLGVTAMRDYVSWGLYISNFVFFVAVSLVGFLISSVLHLLGYKWITPITRIAEQIALAAVALAGIIIITDMGRPDRVLNVIKNARFASPIFWDVTVITTYLAISTLLIYIPLIPDIARLRDKISGVPKIQMKLYNILSLGWHGSDEQFSIIKKAMKILAILVIPVALAIHTVTSWLFAATLRPGWDSTIFGPYFVTGAFVAGVAAVIILMYVYRNRYHLKNYLTDKHFDKMGKLLVLVAFIYLYFNINEFLVPGFKMRKMEGIHLQELFTGRFSLAFWLVQIGGLALPMILLLFKPFRKPTPIFIISLAVLTGAWIKRYLIVVPTLLHPYLPIQNVPENFMTYFPSGTEIMIAALPIGIALLVITLLAKLFPVISLWEIAKENGVSKEDLLS